MPIANTVTQADQVQTTYEVLTGMDVNFTTGQVNYVYSQWVSQDAYNAGDPPVSQGPTQTTTVADCPNSLVNAASDLDNIIVATPAYAANNATIAPVLITPDPDNPAPAEGD